MTVGRVGIVFATCHVICVKNQANFTVFTFFGQSMKKRCSVNGDLATFVIPVATTLTLKILNTSGFRNRISQGIV